MVIIASLITCVGCDKAGARLSTHDQRQAVLDQIADKCGLPRSALKLVGNDELHMQPPVGAKYEAVECMIAGVQKSGFPLKLGFVGNEYYSNEMQQ